MGPLLYIFFIVISKRIYATLFNTSNIASFFVGAYGFCCAYMLFFVHHIFPFACKPHKLSNRFVLFVN